MTLCLLLVTYVPTLSLGLVSISKGGDFIVPFPDPPTKNVAPTGEATQPSTAADTPGLEPAPKGVKSLEELMGEVDDSDAPSTPDPSKPERVKTLEELMNEVE